MVHREKKNFGPKFFFSVTLFSSQNRVHPWGHREVVRARILDSEGVFLLPRILAIKKRPPNPNSEIGLEGSVTQIHRKSMKINEINENQGKPMKINEIH